MGTHSTPASPNADWQGNSENWRELQIKLNSRDLVEFERWMDAQLAVLEKANAEYATRSAYKRSLGR